MKITQQRSAAFDLNSPTVFATPYSHVPVSYITNMYSTQHLQVPPEAPSPRMCSINHAMHGENLMDMKNPKKENIFQTMLNALTNMFGGHLSRIPFMSYMNNPLSVTIVQNQGIISHEFFRTLTRKDDSLTSDHMYTYNIPTKESLNIVKRVNDTILDEKRSHIIEDFDIMAIEHNDYKHQSTMKDTLHMGLLNKNSFRKENFIISMESNNMEEDNDVEEFVFPSTEEIDEIAENMNLTNGEEQQFPIAKFCNEIRFIMGKDKKKAAEQSIKVATSKNDKDIETCSTPPQLQTSSNMLTNLWQKVVSGVTDRFYLKTDINVESKMPVKKLHSPKQGRKFNPVAKGRGRGRARSQLRRSGVSQTRCRKKYTRHNLETDIQDDFEIWQDFELYDTVQTNSPIDSFNIDGNLNISDMAEFIRKDTTSPMVFTFADIQSKRQKPKMCKTVDQEVSKPTRVRYVPDSTDITGLNLEYKDKKYDSQKGDFRPRLMSESSADSEDSYCIVFETESDTNYKPEFNYDEISVDEDEDDDDDEDEDEDEDDEDDDNNDVNSDNNDNDYDYGYDCDYGDDYNYKRKIGNGNEKDFEASLQKVKFNLQPVVHVMVKWDYAYRAARRGPWEEMARDRERFKSRINCTEHILKPILSNQHRSHIWQERFASLD